MSSISINQLYALAALCYGPSHGYALTQRLTDLHAPEHTPHTVTTSLNALAAQGLVTSKPTLLNGRLAHVFTITLDGIAYLTDCAEELTTLASFIKEAQQTYLDHVATGASY